METTRINSSWEDRTEVKKGNIGERIVKDFLEGYGFVLYRPVTDGAHIFDNLAMRNKDEVFVVEVKTKPRRIYYEDTGINIRHFDEYKNISEKHNLKIYLFFVDEIEKEVYGNSLEALAKEHIDKNGKVYPLRQNGIIYFSLEKMETIKELTEQQCNEMAQLTTRNYTYD